MEAMGLTAADVEQPADVELWPDVAPAVELFSVLRTQWRVGFSGPSGLDYSAVPVVMRLLGIQATDRRALFSDLQVMEAEALNQMSQNRK